MSDAALGIVVKATPVREADLVVALYTDAHGRVAAVARGARSSRRRFAGALQLCVLARYQLTRPRRGELWSLDSAEVVREWTALATDVVAHAHAAYIVELVGALVPAEAPDPHALAIVIATWDNLADGGPSPAALRAAELELLELGGHRPALDACAACGERDLAGAVFDPTRGGAICRRCAAHSRGPGVRAVDAGALAYLRAVAAAPTIGDARALDSDPRFGAAERHAARDALVAMVQGLVGKPLRSLEYIAKLGAAGRKP